MSGEAKVEEARETLVLHPRVTRVAERGRPIWGNPLRAVLGATVGGVNVDVVARILGDEVKAASAARALPARRQKHSAGGQRCMSE